MLVELGKQRRANDARLAEWVRRGTRVQVHRLMAKADMAQYLVEVVGIDPHTAQEWKRVGRALAQLPKLAAAMERGDVHFSQGKEVTRVATKDTDAVWTDAAKGSYRAVQRMVRFKKPGDLPTTVVPAEARPTQRTFWLLAEQNAFVQQAIDKAKRIAGRPITDEEALALAAQAFVEGGDGSKRTKRTMLFKCDDCAGAFMDIAGERVRVEDAAANDADPVPAASDTSPAGATTTETSRAGAATTETSRAGAELDPAAIVYDDRSRHIPLPVQRAVFARHRGCCAVPGCKNQLFLQFHHLDDWAEHRRHDASRITLVCTAHHQGIHDRLLVVTGSVATELQFTPAREVPPKPTTWELAESGLRNVGFERHEAKEYVIKARHTAGEDVTVEQALRLALAQVPVRGVREGVERYGPS